MAASLKCLPVNSIISHFSFQTFYFLIFAALCHIKPNMYIKKPTFTAHKRSFFSLLTSRNAKEPGTKQNILCEKKQLTNL